jgi:hypothetical protein
VVHLISPRVDGNVFLKGLANLIYKIRNIGNRLDDDELIEKKKYCSYMTSSLVKSERQSVTAFFLYFYSSSLQSPFKSVFTVFLLLLCVGVKIGSLHPHVHVHFHREYILYNITRVELMMLSSCLLQRNNLRALSYASYPTFHTWKHCAVLLFS